MDWSFFEQYLREPIFVLILFFVILFLFHIAFTIRGFYNPWFSEIVKNYDWPLLVFLISLLFVYTIFIVGYIVLLFFGQNYNNQPIADILLIYIIILFLSLVWDFTFYYLHTLFLSLLISLLIIILTSYAIYLTSKFNIIIAALQIPILIRSLLVFYADCFMTLKYCDNNPCHY